MRIKRQTKGVVGFRLQPDKLAAVDALADRLNVTRNAVLEMAIDAALELDTELASILHDRWGRDALKMLRFPAMREELALMDMDYVNMKQAEYDDNEKLWRYVFEHGKWPSKGS